MDDKLGEESSLLGANEQDQHSNQSDVGARMEGVVECGDEIRKKKKKRKKEKEGKHSVNLENALEKIVGEKLGKESSLLGENERDQHSIQSDVGAGMEGVVECGDEIHQKKKKKKKKKKRKNEKKEGNYSVNLETASEKIMDEKLGKESSLLGENEWDQHSVQLDVGARMEGVVECGDEIHKKKKKKRKKEKEGKHSVNLEIAVEKVMDEKLGKESSLLGVNKRDQPSIQSDVGTRMEGVVECGDEIHKKKKRKKAKSVKNVPEGESNKGDKAVVEATDSPQKSASKGSSKRVSFSESVEVFPPTKRGRTKTIQEDGLVRGKRFSHEEDEMVLEAVNNYINTHGLGEEGLEMVLNCRKYPEVKHCWKEIRAAIPWRPIESVYYRAHILFQRGEKRSWTQEEVEIVRKFHKKHGADWKTLAEVLGKHRFHVKDTWRRIKLPNTKKGNWSQDEYQTLFDLVNMDLRMKAFEEKKTKHGMLRDNICWTAISEQLGTRTNALCCMKWYDHLTSPMVAEGKWLDTDDYRLLNELYNQDACCMEDVDWDNLLEHRPGDVCRKRWNQMVKHLGEHRNSSFAEQVEVLMERYCPDVLEAREAYESKSVVP